MDDQTTQPPAGYGDDDLVYVDPDAKAVVGRIEWNRNGIPKSLPVPETERSGTEEKGKGRRRGSGRKHYPWGTYRSMKRAFQLEGKQGKRTDPGKTLDEVIGRALQEAFWD